MNAKILAAGDESGCSISSHIFFWKWPSGIISSSGFWYPYIKSIQYAFLKRMTHLGLPEVAQDFLVELKFLLPQIDI